MKGTSLDDVIAAISTPVGNGGISIVRISGENSFDLCDKIFRSKFGKKIIKQKSHTILYGEIFDNKNKNLLVDEVLVSIMKAPNTYTTENIVEINCHGGIITARKILEIVLNNGARLSEPGEFTKRAFLNGRIDLSQAEAVMDIINSKTDQSRQAAANQLDGNLKIFVKNIREILLDMIASIEAAIDYPDEQIDEENYESLKRNSKDVLNKINELLLTFDRGKILKDGIQTVILGKPNVGKSSLLNLFLNEERAIVTDIPGTTRDVLEEYVNIDGIPIKLIDTAGIRDTSDVIEKIGVNKSKEYANKADLILFLVDSGMELDEDNKKMIEELDKDKSIIILNKYDLNKNIDFSYIYKMFDNENIVDFSVRNRYGIEQLINKIKNKFFSNDFSKNDEILIGNIRHKNSLVSSKESMIKALNAIDLKMPEDFISMDLQQANYFLGEITGDSVDDEIIDRIFSKFCLGK